MIDEQTSSPPHDQPPRRRFFKKLLALVAAVAAVAPPLASGMAVLLDPLRRRRPITAIDIEITPLAVLPENGFPMRFVVAANHYNAWSSQPNAPIGAIYLRRIGPDRAQALNVVCPHAGCFVRNKDDGTFVCPCHNSQFNADGKIRPGSKTVSPRDLDTLTTRVQDGKVLVQFQNFLAGSSEKIPRS